MKSLIESFLIAFSMYSTLPVKCLNWNEKNLRNAMVFFPLIGAVCGLGVWAVWKICLILEINSFLFSVLGVLAIVLITGGIHLDGFCDTADALYSRRPSEEKLRILKDPACGPFAVFSVILIFALNMGSLSELYIDSGTETAGLLAGGFVISRCLSGISVTRFPYAPTSSLAKTFGENAGKHVSKVLLAELIITVAIMFINYGIISIVLILISLLVFLWYYRMQKREFGGITGDLAGFFVVISETLWITSSALLGGILK